MSQWNKPDAMAGSGEQVWMQRGGSIDNPRTQEESMGGKQDSAVPISSMPGDRGSESDGGLGWVWEDT